MSVLFRYVWCRVRFHKRQWSPGPEMSSNYWCSRCEVGSSVGLNY